MTVAVAGMTVAMEGVAGRRTGVLEVSARDSSYSHVGGQFTNRPYGLPPRPPLDTGIRRYEGLGVKGAFNPAR